MNASPDTVIAIGKSSVKTLIHTLIIPIPTTLIKGFVFLVINELFQGKSAQTSSANPQGQFT